MIPQTIKGLVAYVASIEVVLGMTILWLQSLNKWFSDFSSLILAIAGIVIAYYTIVKLRLDIRARRLDNAIKEIDLERKKNKEPK